MVDLDSKDFEQFVKFHTGENMIQKKSAWQKFKQKDKLLLLLLGIAGLLAVAAVFVLLTPVINFILDMLDLYIEGWAQMSTWLLAGDVGLGVAIALGFLSLVFMLLARFRYVRDSSVFIDAGCPECHEHELIRVRRYRRDRVFGFLGVPVRRYACRNCTWQGTRLAKYSIKTANEKDGSSSEIFEAVLPESNTLSANGKPELRDDDLHEVQEPTFMDKNN